MWTVHAYVGLVVFMWSVRLVVFMWVGVGVRVRVRGLSSIP